MLPPPFICQDDQFHVHMSSKLFVRSPMTGTPDSTQTLLIRLVCILCSLAKKNVAEKKVAITVFSFPPDKGNVGTAAYLNVFGSIYRVLQDLKAQGYTIDDVPEKEEDLIKMVSTQ